MIEMRVKMGKNHKRYCYPKINYIQPSFSVPQNLQFNSLRRGLMQNNWMCVKTYKHSGITNWQIYSPLALAIRAVQTFFDFAGLGGHFIDNVINRGRTSSVSHRLSHEMFVQSGRTEMISVTRLKTDHLAHVKGQKETHDLCKLSEVCSPWFLRVVVQTFGHLPKAMLPVYYKN